MAINENRAAQVDTSPPHDFGHPYSMGFYGNCCLKGYFYLSSRGHEVSSRVCCCHDTTPLVCQELVVEDPIRRIQYPDLASIL